MTPYTFGAYDMRLTRGCVEGDGLMPAIATRQLTTAATHTPLTVDLGIDQRGAVELAGCSKR